MPRSVFRIAACICVLVPAAALASLGDVAGSIEMDRVHLMASARIVVAPRYTVHELHFDSSRKWCAIAVQQSLHSVFAPDLDE